MTKASPLVTVGIPFYNAEKTLADAIRSVFAQTLTDWELILVDDGSTDGGLEIARSVDDPRVRVESDGLNLGLAARLNQIAGLARAELVARMDADDLMSPTRLQRETAVLATHPEVDLVSTGICSVNREGQPVSVRGYAPGKEATARNLLLNASAIAHATIMARTAWFLRNPYDTSIRIAQDYELWLRACARGDLAIEFLVDPLYYWREENKSVRKALLAYSVQRRLLFKYGHLGLSKVDVIRRIVQLWAKPGAVLLLSLVGRMDLVAQRRYELTGDVVARDLKQEVERVLNTEVPGLA